jgi:mannobiose 2-epimerase
MLCVAPPVLARQAPDRALVAQRRLPAVLRSDSLHSSSGQRPAALATRTATEGEYRRLAEEVERNWRAHVWEKWFPRAVDAQRGGFHQNFSEDWSRATGGERSLVYQSRLTWVAAQALLRDAKDASARGHLTHGLSGLAQVLADRQQGGFYWSVDENGRAANNGEKHAYGIAFALYALSAGHKATADIGALQLAQRTFRWLDSRAHDIKNGGYFEALARDGRPILRVPVGVGASPRDFIGTRYGFKSMNTHIHLLEAFTALYEVWPDPLLRRRLQEVFDIVRDRITVEAVGAMHLYFTSDWTPLPDHDSFGHDIETAFLLVEASTALGQPDDVRTWTVARRLVDHALEFGWDSENGGFYDAGGVFGPVVKDEKIWWVQAEGLNALLMLHERFGRQTPRYWNCFLQQWSWIQSKQVDAVHGGWHPYLSREGVATPGRNKSDAWTEASHQGRALLHVSSALRRLSGEPAVAHR